jgi:hypothetical protein
MREFLIVAVIFALIFWFSLHPGSRLGVAITTADFGSIWRDLDRKELQTRKRLRVAGQKSLVFYCLLLLVGVSAGVTSGNYTFAQISPGLCGGFTGLVLAYSFLHWSTRRGGWCGLP